MLRTTLRSLVALALLSSGAHAQNGQFFLQSFFDVQGGLNVRLGVAGPPNSFFDVYYALDLNGTGLTLLTSGTLGPGGQWAAVVPVQAPLQLQQLWVGAIVSPPAGPPFIAGFAAAAGAAVVAPCDPSGAMVWDPVHCMINLSAKVCPGDVVEIKINGVTVLTSPAAGANGRIAMGLGGLCPMAAGSSITATRNGAAFLGAIIT